MAEMYVGNVTRQRVEFAYRVPERKGVVVQPIPIGGQVRLAPNGSNTNLSAPDIDYIIAQHLKYGFTNITELDAKNPEFKFTGLCYSINKPIPVDKLMQAMDKDEERLEEIGRKMRQEAAVAVNSRIEDNIGAPLRGLEMSVSEIEPPGGFRDEGTMKHVAEGVRVTRKEGSDLPQIEPSTRRSRRR